jgi:hypothetical protein
VRFASDAGAVELSRLLQNPGPGGFGELEVIPTGAWSSGPRGTPTANARICSKLQIRTVLGFAATDET